MDRQAGPTGAGRGFKRVGLFVLAVAASAAGYLIASELKHVLTTGDLIIPAEVVTLIIYAPIVVTAVGAWLVARRTRSVTVGGLAAIATTFLAGSVGAAILAPSYVPPRSYPGTVELRIESPVSLVASGPADCQSIPDGTHFANASAGYLTGLGPYAVQVTASIHGGLSQDGPVRRDGIGLIIAERPAVGEVADAEAPLGEFVADESTVLSITTEGAGGHSGSMSFVNLRQSKGDGAFGAPNRIVISGAVSWSCAVPQ